MDVTVFSAASCGKCVATKYGLRKRDIPFTEVRVDQDPAVEEHVRNAFGGGPVSLPIVMAFRHDEDEVPDILTDFHPQYLDALKDTNTEIPEVAT
jgi:glutaredoxin